MNLAAICLLNHGNSYINSNNYSSNACQASSSCLIVSEHKFEYLAIGTIYLDAEDMNSDIGILGAIRTDYGSLIVLV